MFAAIDNLLRIDGQASGLSYFAPVHASKHTNAYVLLFTDDKRALILRAIDLEILNRKKAKRILAANITDRTLERVTIYIFEKLTPYRRVNDATLLRQTQRDLEEFIKHRADRSEPYFGRDA